MEKPGFYNVVPVIDGRTDFAVSVLMFHFTFA